MSSIFYNIVQIIGTNLTKRKFYVQFYMTKTVKNYLLKQLYYLKSIGYNYHENLDLFSTNTKTIKLPNSLNELEESVKHCYLCEFSKTRKNTLFSYGNSNSKIVFIKDEPTSSEDELNTFYAGKSGEILCKMIENVLEVKKEEVYLTGLTKCKSTNGLNKTCVDSCKNYLIKQLELIKPKLVVLLGENTYNYFVEPKEEFSKIRGKEFKYNGLNILSTYSPSFLIRNPSFKKDAYYDMIKIKNIMEK